MEFFQHPVALVAFGILVGIFSGIMGLGGGAIMIPVMVLALGLTQHQASGTSLAVMIPPVTLPAVIAYWKNGRVRLDLAAWIALGVLLGTFIGAYIANLMPKDVLRLSFGFVLVYVAAYTIFGKENLSRTTILSAALAAIAVAMWLAVRWYDSARAG